MSAWQRFDVFSAVSARPLILVAGAAMAFPVPLTILAVLALMPVD